MAKSITSWNNSGKSLSTWVNVGKTVNAWSNGSVVQTPYVYDSAIVTYDNTYSYDYLVPFANQTNKKIPIVWVG